MLLITTVLLLNLLPTTLSSVTEFNNTILKYQTWPTGNCSEIIPESLPTCKTISDIGACTICNETSCTIHVAVMFPQSEEYILNLNRTEAIIRKAAKDVKSIIPQIDFEIRSLDDGCRSEVALGHIIDLNIEWCPHVLFAHTCDYTLAGVARVAKFLGKSGVPLLSPGGFTYDFTAKRKVVMEDEMYHLVNVGSVGFSPFVEIFHLLADRFGWKKIAVIYDKTGLNEMGGEGACYLLSSTIIDEFTGTGINFQGGDVKSLGFTYETFFREKVGVDYAIVLTCSNHSNIRSMAIEAAKLGMMDKGEYLFINFALYNNAPYPDSPWRDDADEKNNELAKKGFSSFLTVYPYREAQFERVEKQSFRGSFYLDDVYDSMFMYAQTIRNMTSPKTLNSLRGCDTVQYIMGKTFEDNNGDEIMYNCNNGKLADYALLSQDKDGHSEIIGIYRTKNRTITYWNPGNFSFPPDTPECGFDLSKCPTYDKVNILLISLICVILIGLMIVSTVIYRHYKLKAEIYAQAWKVNYNEIAFFSKDRKSSIHSLLPMKDSEEISLAGENQLYAQIGHYNSIRVAIKKLPDIKINLSHKQLYELKVMKDLSHNNLVKFYGACIDSPNNCLLVEYCPRGSLQDILEDLQYNLDWDFRTSLIMDIAKGMQYLHNSAIRSHGALKSSNCLVDSRFVLKISDFGLHFLKGNGKHDTIEKNSHEYWKRFLWTAPELLRMSNSPPEGTQKGDVYSFGIIMEEVIMREGVFYVKGCNLEPESM